MDFEEIRSEIQAQLASAIERREKLARHVDNRAEPLPPDFSEQAQELENDETMVALSAELDTMIRELDATLDRLADGSYGKCADCGEWIDASRLEALPSATRCLACAE